METKRHTCSLTQYEQRKLAVEDFTCWQQAWQCCMAHTPVATGKIIMQYAPHCISPSWGTLSVSWDRVTLQRVIRFTWQHIWLNRTVCRQRQQFLNKKAIWPQGPRLCIYYMKRQATALSVPICSWQWAAHKLACWGYNSTSQFTCLPHAPHLLRSNHNSNKAAFVTREPCCILQGHALHEHLTSNFKCIELSNAVHPVHINFHIII